MPRTDMNHGAERRGHGEQQPDMGLRSRIVVGGGKEELTGQH